MSKQLFRYLGKYRFAIVLVVIMSVGSTVFAVLGPKIMGKATTELANGIMRKVTGTGGIDFHYIAKVLLVTLGFYIFSSFMNLIQGLIMTEITQKTCYRLRKDIVEKMNRLPMNYFEGNTNGEILSRITNDVDTLGTSLNQSITQFITSVVTLIGTVLMMLSISWVMTGIAILVFPLAGSILSFIVKRSQKYFRRQQEYLGHVNGLVEEIYAGHIVIKAFNKEEDMLETFRDANEVLCQSAWKSQFFSGLMHPVMLFIGNLGYVGVAITGGVFAIKNMISIGNIQAFIQYVKNFSQPIQQIAQVTTQFQSMSAASERVFAFLEEEEEEQNGKCGFSIDEVVGQVSFQTVSFGYHPGKTVIQNFSLEVEPGQKIAIVGPTGSGKSTLVKLLMRFYDINQGKILIDGHDIKSYQRQKLREAFGVVLQDTWLFNGTIMENIRYGRLEASDQEVKEAAKAAHAEHFILSLPDGYEMVLNEEASNISQGQKQLLTIARTILADNPILILDEATSSVDTRTEVLIQQALNYLMKGRTSFIIAHRLTTIKNADKILVMKDGNVIEQGSHEELLRINGFYADLYRSQYENKT